MIKIEFDTSQLTKFARDLDRRIQQMPGKMALLMKGREGRIALRAIARLGKEPGQPHYPIKFTTPKQRKAFFASKGFGRGIPTVRNNDIIHSWTAKVRTDQYGGVIILLNAIDAWVYVQGPYVQQYHVLTGYTQLSEVQDDFYRDGLLIIADTWADASNPFEG